MGGLGGQEIEKFQIAGDWFFQFRMAGPKTVAVPTAEAERRVPLSSDVFY
jgi:hypothetical protein